MTHEARLAWALRLVLDQVDYTVGNCRITEQVAAVLPAQLIRQARDVLSGIASEQIPYIGRARTGPEVLRAWAKTRSIDTSFRVDLNSCADHLEAANAETKRLRELAEQQEAYINGLGQLDHFRQTMEERST